MHAETPAEPEEGYGYSLSGLHDGPVPTRSKRDEVGLVGNIGLIRHAHDLFVKLLSSLGGHLIP